MSWSDGALAAVTITRGRYLPVARVLETPCGRPAQPAATSARNARSSSAAGRLDLPAARAAAALERRRQPARDPTSASA